MVTENQLKEGLKRGAKMKVRYTDYDEGVFTIPYLITEERIMKVINDESVDEIIIIEK
jgi:hypothetical protein